MLNFLKRTAQPHKQEETTEVFEPTRLELKIATSVADEVSQNWRESMNHPKEHVGRLRAQVIEDPYARVSLKDVEMNINLIADQSRVFMDRFGGIPCIGLESGDMPICSAREFYGPPGSPDKPKRPTKAPEYPNDDDAANEFLKRGDHPMLVTLDEARRVLREALRRFLSHRFGGYRSSVSYQGVPSSGLEFNRVRNSSHASDGIFTPGDIKDSKLYIAVRCKEENRRVHSSPAYFVDWTYFGHSDTRKVSGWLLPGRYIFSTDGPGTPAFLPDNAVFPIRSIYTPNVTKF